MKKILFLSLMLVILFGVNINASPELATLINQDGEKKVVEVGCSSCFDGGWELYTERLGTAIPDVIAVFETSLASKITSTQTTMTLVSGTTDDSTTLNGTYGFVIDEGSASQEFVLATCVDTACSSMTRGISTITGTSTVSSLKKSHRRGASVKITDHPVLTTIVRILNGQGTLPSILTYENTVTPISDKDLIPKSYADNLTNQGAATSTESVAGISELATRIENASSTQWGVTEPHVQQSEHATSSPGSGITENWDVWTETDGKINQSFLDLTEDFTFSGDNTHSATTTFSANTIGIKIIEAYTASTTIAVGQAVYLASSTNAVGLSDANDATKFGEFLGIAKTAGVNGDTIYVQTFGLVDGLSLTAGQEYWVTDTAGTIGTTLGTYPIMIGRALSTTQLLLQRERRKGTAINLGTNDISAVAVTDGLVTAWGNENNTQTNVSCYVNGTQVSSHQNYDDVGAGGSNISCFVGKGDTYAITYNASNSKQAYLTPIN